MREVEILRAYREGAITRVADPWHFLDSGWACVLDHQFDGVYMAFSYPYALSTTALPQGAQPEATPALTLRANPPFELVGPTLLELDGDKVTLARWVVETPNAKAFALNYVQGDTAQVLMDAISKNAEVAASGSRSSPATSAVAFRATMSTSQVAELAPRLKACVAAHSDTGVRH